LAAMTPSLRPAVRDSIPASALIYLTHFGRFGPHGGVVCGAPRNVESLTLGE